MDKFRCGRRGPWCENSPLRYDQVEVGDHWRDDDTCSYCGSLSSDTLMARLRAGDIELTPTDKNYKVYVGNKGGDLFRQSYRDCPRDSDCYTKRLGPDACPHWVMKETYETKFYFQHLSDEQINEFIDLLNAQKIQLTYPGHFYVLPYFCKPKGN